MQRFGGILTRLKLQLKGLLTAMSAQPTEEPDESALEHLLLYHGLVGSTPDNQRQFSDTRSDLQLAVQERNSSTLAVALRLPPLWWEERLQSIFAELNATDREGTLATLLPEATAGETLPPSANPLEHEDWRVRANTAKVLAYLKADQASARLIKSLEDAKLTARPAFCHIAQALGFLQTPDTREALRQYLHDDEPWFRVDAARALVLWPAEVSAPDLMAAMSDSHLLSDYMAITIAQKYSVSDLLQSDQLRSGALEVIIGTISAASQTFTPDIISECKILECWPQVFALSQQGYDPATLRATWLMAKYLTGDWQHQAEAALDRLSQSETVEALLKNLQNVQATDADIHSQIRHTILLLGDLKHQAAHAQLSRLLKTNFIRLDETIEALGKLGDASVCPALIALAQELIDLEKRTNHPLSKQPVVEAQPAQAKTYWLILKALGQLPHPDGLSFLLKASGDFAADKRQQAYASLVCVAAHGSFNQTQAESVQQVISTGLQDPWSPIKVIALVAVGQLGLVALLPETAKLCLDRESKVSRTAFETLSQLAKRGHGPAVFEQLQQKARLEFDAQRRKQLMDFGFSLQR